MKLGILLFIIGAVFALYLANIKFKKKFLKKLGIFLGVILALYGLILLIQPDDYIKFTKTTVSTSK